MCLRISIKAFFKNCMSNIGEHFIKKMKNNFVNHIKLELGPK